MRIHWHRRDLRTSDNAGLAAATADSPVVPVFVFDDAVLDHAAPPRVAFMLDALDSLRAQYRDRGSDLVIARGDPTAEIPRLAEAFGADGVTWGEAYSGLGIERDIAVRQALDDAGVEREAVTDSVLHRPGEITTNDGDPYSVFTYFGRKWHDREKDEPYDAPSPDELADVSGDPLPSIDDLGFEEPQAELPPAGTEPARDLLDAFCEDDIYRYEDRRDYPADDCTSRLSAHLKFGTIGIREVYERTASAAEAANDEERRESVEEFQSQLAWREFYTQVLFANRSVVTDNYKSYERPLQWRDDPEALQAWKDGETGYPIVDAGMRQLRQEAFMHNRVRMIVASFLTKDLLIDWRAGYEWFKQRLVDHDTANDNGGWQWAASTGTDAQPYFRIFNPMTQGERYDPDAEYIKTYVPELRDAEPSVIHEWPDLSPTQRRNAAPEYPDPIVDHSERRDQALEMFETARGES
ncbi:deoxyribodipyrimidine photo-lyase [Halomicrobium mukohataei]|uniref:Deoxyribodipyrimidine photo-lyase n=1 Tax=Halomicrobium mukohataei TaxID=57705 RepID=A0A847UH04_9EURY|nr:deoxyribodipyrimidine photo-lyase [Halomicrobium mukohataei]NLV10794.1 deoxyribodipyrimidine photo-lyase [Halomicrobium mukohataei]